MSTKVAENSLPPLKSKRRGGRAKGTPNKDTQHIVDVCAKHNFDPVEVLVFIAMNDWQSLGYDSPEQEKLGSGGIKIFEDRIKVESRADAAKTLMNFIYPKRKSVEFKDELSSSIKPIVLAYSEESLKKAASNDEAKD